MVRLGWLVARAVRIKIDPIPEADPDDGALVEAVQVSLTELGKGSSQATLDDPTPATITFRLALLDQARGADSEPRREELGTLTGGLLVRAPDFRPVFVVAPDAAETALTRAFESALSDPVPPPDEGVEPSSEAAARRPKPRVLPLEFDALSFEGTDALPDARLVIPSDLLADARYLELESELSVNDAAEGAFELNDVLDARITAESPPPVPALDVLLLDDVGQPLDGVALRFSVDGDDEVVTTDATGFARLVRAEPASATVTIDDIAALRTRMKPEWDKTDRPVPKALPSEDDDDTTIFALRGDESPEALVDTDVPRRIVVCPYVFLARLQGLFFDLGKTFLLPTALGGLKDVRSLYDANNPSTLLIVGHTDTSASPATNDPLSLERARSMRAFLEDDADTWAAQFDSGTAASRRWGKHEEEQMIEALGFDAGRQAGESHVAFFHRTRGLPPGEKLASDERKQLIGEYMALDGAELDEAGTDIDVVTHGCGENFPVDASGEELDDSPADGVQDQLDRRVELYFFDKQLGVQPPVADGSNSKAKSREYPEWRRRALVLEQIGPAGGARDRVISVILLSNSGNLPLANRKVTLTIEGEPPFDGQSDANGVFEKTGVPAGDHLLTVEGVSSFVAATPPSVSQVPHVLIGHDLLADQSGGTGAGS